MMTLLFLLQEGWIVLSDGTAVRPDGSARKEIKAEVPRAAVRDGVVVIDGSIEIPHEGARSADADAKHVVFDGGGIWRVTLDGKDKVKLADEGRGPRFAGDGRILYSIHHPMGQKMNPSTLMIMDADGKNARELIKRELIEEYVPRGERIAVSIGAEGIRVLNLKGETERTITFADLDKELFCHGAWGIVWSPDGKSLACRITFLGGRKEGTVIAGDTQVYVVSPDGELRAIEVAERDRPVRWIE